VWADDCRAQRGAVLVVIAQELIELAGQRLVEAAGSPARVILFGSAARGELTRDSDLDFLVIERDVENRVAEAVRCAMRSGGLDGRSM
jgi:predicted nucleotidyltransferase